MLRGKLGRARLLLVDILALLFTYLVAYLYGGLLLGVLLALGNATPRRFVRPIHVSRRTQGRRAGVAEVVLGDCLRIYILSVLVLRHWLPLPAHVTIALS